MFRMYSLFSHFCRIFAERSVQWRVFNITLFEKRAGTECIQELRLKLINRFRKIYLYHNITCVHCFSCSVICYSITACIYNNKYNEKFSRTVHHHEVFHLEPKGRKARENFQLVLNPFGSCLRQIIRLDLLVSFERVKEEN